MTDALISLGSNMGDRSGYLREAVNSFGGAVRLVSSVYRTPPWGPVEQDDYYNLVLTVSDPAIDAAGWLDRCHVAESAAGRERLLRWGPRTLDADVVAVWNPDGSPVISNDDLLTLPHPRAHERGFVLIPWAELDPQAALPEYGPISDLIAVLDASEVEAIVRVGRWPLDEEVGNP